MWDQNLVTTVPADALATFLNVSDYVTSEYVLHILN